MIQFPHNFVQLERYPGYYWNIADKTLYTMKVDGVLKPMKLKRAYRGPDGRGGFIDTEAGYQISVNGRRRTLSQRHLSTIKVPQEVQIVPTKEST